MPRFRTAAARLLAAALLPTLAPPPARADAPVASDPVFTALTVDGGTSTGRVRQFGPGGDVTLVKADGSERIVALDALVKLTRDGAAAPAPAEAPAVLFPDGDRLYRAVTGASAETTLSVQSFTLQGPLAVPVESVLGLVLALPTDSDALDGLLARVRGEPRQSEVLWLANGDRMAGGFLGLTDKTVEFQPGKDPVKVDRAGVVGLGFDPALVVYPKPEGGFLEMTLSDGSRLGVTHPRVEQGYVSATTRFGAAVRFPIADLMRVHARTASVVYLSEREPAAAKYVPYVGPARPYRRDATVDGGPLRLSGQDYERGIGTQSRTLLAYRLERGDRRFQALVGVDDRAGPLGSVVFRVLVDGKERFVSPVMSARDAPRALDLDISDARSLILATEFGDRGGVRDLADWVEARVIRGPSRP